MTSHKNGQKGIEESVPEAMDSLLFEALSRPGAASFDSHWDEWPELSEDEAGALEKLKPMVKSATGVIKLSALSGKSDCCVCKGAVRNVELAICSECQAPYHAECFHALDDCAIFGCEGRYILKGSVKPSSLKTKSRRKGGKRWSSVKVTVAVALLSSCLTILVQARSGDFFGVTSQPWIDKPIPGEPAETLPKKGQMPKTMTPMGSAIEVPFLVTDFRMISDRGGLESSDSGDFIVTLMSLSPEKRIKIRSVNLVIYKRRNHPFELLVADPPSESAQSYLVQLGEITEIAGEAGPWYLKKSELPAWDRLLRLKGRLRSHVTKGNEYPRAVQIRLLIDYEMDVAGTLMRQSYLVPGGMNIAVVPD